MIITYAIAVTFVLTMVGVCALYGTHADQPKGGWVSEPVRVRCPQCGAIQDLYSFYEECPNGGMAWHVMCADCCASMDVYIAPDTLRLYKIA